MLVLGAGSIGLVVWIFLLGVFIVGCGMFLVGTIAFGITTAKHEKKRFRIIFAVIAIIGIVMIVIPSLKLHYLRQANGEDHENCVETDYNTQYHYEFINGDERMYFSYDGVKYCSVDIMTIAGEEMGTCIPQKRLVKSNAVLNIQEKIDILDRLFNSYVKQTVYTIKNDFGNELLVTEDRVFSPEDELQKAKSFYGDLSRYDFYKDVGDDDNVRDGIPLDIGNEIQRIKGLDLSKTVKDVKGKEKEIDFISKDGLFEGCLYFKNKGNKLYMYVNLGEEDYDADEDYDEYLRIPNDIAKSLIPKLETK